MGRTRKHVKNSIKLTLLSKVNFMPGSWMCPTLFLIVIHSCTIYGVPMSNQEKVRGRTPICTDRQTDTVQTKWFLYTPLNFVYRGYNNITILITFVPNILSLFLTPISLCLISRCVWLPDQIWIFQRLLN